MDLTGIPDVLAAITTPLALAGLIVLTACRLPAQLLARVLLAALALALVALFLSP